MTRDDILRDLRQKPQVSVLIVGGGINGIGTFRDLALNAVDVLLIDRADFCSGASAASSHMAHGGVRYLENGEFRLVREAVQERNRLIENAPHLVRPLPTTIPIFKVFSGIGNAPLKFLGLLDRPSERGSVVIKIGLMLYDAYTGKRRIVPRHRFLNRADSLARWSKLNPAVVNTATYFDGAILQPEHLGLEIILDAEAENPEARALNYVKLVRADGDRVWLEDGLTGASYEVRPRLVINAAGPWIDSANQALGLSTRLIGGTKGSHLVLDHPELLEAIGQHEFFFENKDGRIVLIFPLYDRVLAGTSDIPLEEPDMARCTEQEVDYFIEMIGRVFPSIQVGRKDIVFRFSGVRPLAASKSKTTGQISREHEIHVDGGNGTELAFPVYSLVGGKWTSFRAFGEQASDKALAFLQKQRIAGTGNVPIGGGRLYPASEEGRRQFIDDIAARARVPLARVQVLFDRYGTRAAAIAAFIALAQDAPLRKVRDYSRREIGFIAQEEKVMHLDDLLLRRSMLAMLGRLTRPALEETADVLGGWLKWPDEQRRGEVQRVVTMLADVHGVEL